MCAHRKRHILKSGICGKQLAAFGLVSFGACSSGDRPGPFAHVADAVRIAPRAPGRIFAPARWDTIVTIQADDSILFRPRLLEAQPGRLYVYDYIDARIKAFDRNGKLLWRFGGYGRGPKQFLNVPSLATAADGSLWAVDGGSGGNARFALLSPEGDQLKNIPTTEPILRVIPTANELLGATLSRDKFLVSVDPAGGVAAEYGFPLRELKDAEPTIRQPLTALDRTRTIWAAIFPFGDLLLVYRGHAVQCAGRLIEGEKFPHAATGLKPNVSAVAVAFADSSIFVLPKGKTADAMRMLDEYSIKDCTYRRTMRLPGKFMAMSISANTFYFEYETPKRQVLGATPGLVGLQMVSPQLTQRRTRPVRR